MTVRRGIHPSDPRWIDDLYTKKTIVRGYGHPYYRHMINAIEFFHLLKSNWQHITLIMQLSLERSGLGRYTKAEIKMLSKFCHCHIVSLLGYCEDSSTHEMILVYEYMPNESLHHHLHKRKVNGRNSSPLTWVQRPNICIGSARALDYLYTGTGVKSRVIHHDVKSPNVLLDENLVAKIFDFGVSRIGPANRCVCIRCGLIGNLCGMLALIFTLDEQQHILAGRAKHCIKEGGDFGGCGVEMRWCGVALLRQRWLVVMVVTALATSGDEDDEMKVVRWWREGVTSSGGYGVSVGVARILAGWMRRRRKTFWGGMRESYQGGGCGVEMRWCGVALLRRQRLVAMVVAELAASGDEDDEMKVVRWWREDVGSSGGRGLSVGVAGILAGWGRRRRKTFWGGSRGISVARVIEKMMKTPNGLCIYS
nr:serine/threonine/dual specificity protein kinase, catalytic domain-containing protein [Tanacetum cinerariifolium]